LDLENFDFTIDFIFLDITKFPFPEKHTREWILQLINTEGKVPGILNFIFCTDSFLLDINKQYLDHDEYTDIVTFDYSKEFNNVSGDVYISIERIEENAQSFNNEFIDELHRVLAHGVLHIIGYKDKNTSDKKIMTEKENHYLRLIDFL
jgi:rRNA maturation RNase YbeY